MCMSVVPQHEERWLHADDEHDARHDTVTRARKMLDESWLWRSERVIAYTAQRHGGRRSLSLWMRLVSILLCDMALFGLLH